MKKLKIIFIILCFTTSILAQKKESSLGEKIPCKEIDLGCLILGREISGEHIIKNNTEYQELLEFLSPHVDCGNYQLPIIDFNSYTMVGYISSVSGCSSPQFSYKIVKYNSEYTININIVQHGFCKINNLIVLWCLIPKVNNNISSKFNIETIIED